jgi:threonine/homoserine/homoserine lactone efflux protein
VVIGIVIVWFVLGVLVTLAAPTLSAPSDAYAKWTNQLIGVLGAAIGARVLWKLPETLQIWANNHKPN